MAEIIDFVVLWVDGADPEWQAQRQAYRPQESNNGNAQNRYRDWGLMRYWFRCVERYAPWVNRVWFVTNGQVPAWLNREHPKLRLISHREYIPEQYLPTFNSNVIELWLHKIPELSEHFVLFNDDMFLTAPVKPTDFFVNGVPVESALLDQAASGSPDDCLPYMLLNNSAVINKHFRKRQVLKENFGKFFSLKYGADLMRNILLAPFLYFSTFRDPHLPSAYCKETFAKVWQAEEQWLERCSSNRFRSKTDLTHWLMKAWQFCEGNFRARPTNWGRHYELWEDDIDRICSALMTQKYRTICLNDSKTDIDFPLLQRKLNTAFLQIFPNPSGFER